MIVHPADRVAHRHVAVLLEVMERTFWRVDRYVREIRAAESFELGVEVGEVAALEEWIV